MKKPALLSFLAFPAFAQAASNSFAEALRSISTLINTLMSIAFSLAFLAFFWGMFKYLGTSSEETKKSGLQIMATSIAVIFIMTSIWGVVTLLRNTLKVPSGSGAESINFPKAVPNRF